MMEKCLNLVDNHMESVREFRTELERAILDMDGNDGRPPLVFIIDELDRCRPTYALSVLERMKHVFDVNGVCFVLVTYLEGLKAMVHRAYGLSDAESYLKKFYHRRFDIQKLLYAGSENLRSKYLDHLASLLVNDVREATDFITITVNNLTRLHDLSLRSQERIMVNVAVFQKSMTPVGHMSEHDHLRRAILAPGLCVLREQAPSLYEDASVERLVFSNVAEFLRLDEWEGVSPMGVDQIRDYWILASVDGDEHLTDQQKKQNRSRSATYSTENRHWVAKICVSIDQLWQ